MKFLELNLSEKIVKAVESLGFDTATEVQEKTIPFVLQNKNVVVRSQTGSGKTFAFALPVVEKIDFSITTPQTLVICPTRELCLQVTEEIRKVTRFLSGVSVVPVYGGSDIHRQIVALKKKPQIVVGTPGRIMDHLDRHTLKLHDLKTVVLDEADEMLDMGFKEDIEKILKSAPRDRQTLLFSATYPEKIKQIVDEYIVEYEKIEIGQENKSLSNIKQSYAYVGNGAKLDALFEVLFDKREDLILIFANTKAWADKIANALIEKKYSALALHGDLRQSQRKKVIDSFKNGQTKILVASDVAARGLDINNIDYVINYDLPHNLEYFLHRMGRTARAGKKGSAITIISNKNQYNDLKMFEKETSSTMQELKLNASQSIPTKDKNNDKKSFGKKSGESKRGVSNRFDRKDRKSAFGKSDKKEYKSTDRKSDKDKYSKDDKKSYRGEKKSFRDDKKSFKDNKKSFKDDIKEDKKPYRDSKKSFRDDKKNYRDDKKSYKSEKSYSKDGNKYKKDDNQEGNFYKGKRENNFSDRKFDRNDSKGKAKDKQKSFSTKKVTEKKEYKKSFEKADKKFVSDDKPERKSDFHRNFKRNNKRNTTRGKR